MHSRCDIVEAPQSKIGEYGEIPSRFEVRSVFRVDGEQAESAILTEVPVAQPWIKDYDCIPDEGPANWSKRWHPASWTLFGAYAGSICVGACVITLESADGGSGTGPNTAVLWDIRVHPDYQRRGVGRELFNATLAWAKRRGCRQLTVETQNINVRACRFYQQMGCRLASIERRAYAAFPDEVKLVWSLSLHTGDLNSPLNGTD